MQIQAGKGVKMKPIEKEVEEIKAKLKARRDRAETQPLPLKLLNKARALFCEKAIRLLMTKEERKLLDT